MVQIVQVILPVPLFKLFDYLYTGSQPIQPFMRIVVPFGRRTTIGVISDIKSSSTIETTQLKTVIQLIDSAPLLSGHDQKLFSWVKNYYHANPYQLLQLFLPKKLRKEAKPPVTEKQWYYTLLDHELPLAKNAHQQIKVIHLLQIHQELDQSLCQQYDISSQTLKRLCEKNIIQRHYRELKALIPQAANKAKILSDEQQKAVTNIRAHLHHFQTILLYGVTGSGKTEVYLEAIAPLIAEKKQILILVPEINLTPQTLQRFQQRFAVTTTILNSYCSDEQRFQNWLAIQSGQIQIVIATRLGVFYHFNSLAMIIVDEEHDSSFKQQNAPYYHARDVAIVKAKQLNIPIILGSATPSLESYYHATSGKYVLLELKNKAFNTPPASIELINLQQQKLTTPISTKLKQQIDLVLGQKKQVLLFINRRGFAHRLLCRHCGWSPTCPNCDRPYTLHHHPQHLSCHFCGKGHHIFTQCRNCHAQSLIDLGAGTEKIEYHIQEDFPNARIIRFDKTTISNQEKLTHAFDKIHQQETDIIIGTQMVAKGHDFSHIGLVAILDTDTGLFSQDFHATERTAQLVTQIIGRTGRRHLAGKIFIQTYQPNHPLFQLIRHETYTAILQWLLTTRQLLNYPPFTFQAYVYVSAVNASKASNTIEKIVQHLNQHCKNLDYQQAGPLPALHAKKNNRFYFALLLTAPRRVTIHGVVAEINAFWFSQKPNQARIAIDIDPVEMQ